MCMKMALPMGWNLDSWRHVRTCGEHAFSGLSLSGVAWRTVMGRLGGSQVCQLSRKGICGRRVDPAKQCSKMWKYICRCSYIYDYIA